MTIPFCIHLSPSPLFPHRFFCFWFALLDFYAFDDTQLNALFTTAHDLSLILAFWVFVSHDPSTHDHLLCSLPLL